MARTVARAIQDMLGSETERLVKIQLVTGDVKIGHLEDLEQFDEAVILVSADGIRTVIPMSSIAALEIPAVNP